MPRVAGRDTLAQKWLDLWPKTPRRSGRGDVLIRTWSFSDPVFALNFVLTVICGQSLFWPLKRFDFKISKPFCRLKKPERVFNLFCGGWPSCLYCHYGPENNQKNRIFGETTAFRLYPFEAEMPRQHMLRHKVLKSFRIWDKRGFDPLNLGHCFGQGKRTRVVVSWLLLSVPKENLFWITTALNRGQKIPWIFIKMPSLKFVWIFVKKFALKMNLRQKCYVTIFLPC